MPVLTLNARPSAHARLLIALFVFTLLATASPVWSGPATAADLGTEISQSRRSQQLYERAMLRYDRTVAKTQRLLKKNRKAYKQAKRDAIRGKKALRLVTRIVAARQERLASVESAYPTPEDAPKPWKYKERLQNVRSSLRVAEARKGNIASRVRVKQRVRRASLARITKLKRERDAAIRKREAAEAGLAAHIVRMTRLAAVRAELQSTVQLTAHSDAFSWPAVGRISQTYGCTGFYINPPRGSCRHFHDGLDIVDAHGSPVRAAAMGVVAFVGWNPWDERGRAFIVVVAHPDGFVTRYGHVMASKKVRAGEVVHTGQVIARMGNTGYSTGTHLHFELLRNGSDVSPFAYLPSGVVKVKVDRDSTRKAKAKAKAKAKRQIRQKAKAEARRAKDRRRKAARAERRAAAAAAAEAAAVAAAADECIEAATPSTQAPPAAYPDASPFGLWPEQPEPPATCPPPAAVPASEDAPESVLLRSDPMYPVLSEPEPKDDLRRHLPFRGTSPVPE